MSFKIGDKVRVKGDLAESFEVTTDPWIIGVIEDHGTFCQVGPTEGPLALSRSLFTIDCLELVIEESPLYDQTIQFWHLQLQFFEMDFATLIGMIDNLMIAGLYVKNKKSKKIKRYVADLRDWGTIPDSNQKECVATHLALQLSGLA